MQSIFSTDSSSNLAFAVTTVATFAFSALILLIGCQKEHLACKN